ncbi:MAG: amidohydrolase family protein [Haloferacaceae archaeon]
MDATVVDTDAHYFEPAEDIAPYFEEPWRTRILGSWRDPESMMTNLFPGSTGDQEVYGRIERTELDTASGRGLRAPEDVALAMDHVGVDKCIILSHRMLSFARLEGEDARQVVLANGYVDYMLEKVVDPSEGIYTMAPVPFKDPEAAVELIDRVADERGVVGLAFVTPGVKPPLGHRRYDVIYEAAERAGLPAVFHSGGASLDYFYINGYEKFIETHTLGFMLNNAAQLTSLVVQGVPEKFPDLDIVFQESGLFWIPTMMYRLDAEYMKRQSEAPLLTKRPSKYLQEFYYGTQPMEQPSNPRYLEYVFEMIGGPDRLMYTSDYPHWDYDPPSVITKQSFLSDAEKAQILGGNAEEVFDV